MKKVLNLLLLGAIAFTACSDDKDYYVERTKESLYQLANLSEEIVPEFKEGFNTLYMMGEDTVFYGNMHIVMATVPVEVKTKALNPPVFIPNNKGIEFSNSKREGILMFEDIIDGDFDYNDFILDFKEDLKVSKKDGRYEVKIAGSNLKPLAMGNMIPLSFGFEIRDSKTKELLRDEVVFHDVRQECFGGRQGFINTVKGEASVNVKTLHTEDKVFYFDSLENPIALAWYIIANGEKHYTVDAALILGGDVDYVSLANEAGYPYGIFYPINNTSQFRYMEERSQIWESYPNFKRWVAGQDVAPFGTIENTDKLYN